MAYASSYPSTSTLAPAYGNFATFSRVDVESLLWEMSHIVRGLTKVARTQQAKLNDEDSSSELIAEYEERASAALRAVDTALDQMAADVLVQEDDAWYDVDRQGVAAWALATHQELSQDEQQAEQQQPPVEIPADFWETHDFNWDDEPEELEWPTTAPAAPVVPLFATAVTDNNNDLPLDEAADELVLPSDSVTSRGDSDSEYADDDENEDEWEGYSDASFEAGEREHFAFHNQQQQQVPVIEYDVDVSIETAPAPLPVAVADADSAMRALRRHSWLGVGGGHSAAAAAAVSTRFDSAAALLGKLFQQTTAAHAGAIPLSAF